MPDRLAEKAVIGYVSGGHPELMFEASLLELQKWDLLNARRTVHPGPSVLPLRTTNIAHGRNQIVRAFLEETDSDWLWFVDDDETFPPDTLERLIAAADPVDRPILSGLVFAQTNNRTLPVSPAAVVFDPGSGMLVEALTYPVGELWQVGSAGAGCLLIHRRVLEEMGEKYAEDAWPWFKYAQSTMNLEGAPDVMGEDYTFSLRAQAMGYPVLVDTSIECGHIKKVTLTSADFWRQLPSSEIPRRTAAVIPVKGRKQMTLDLLDAIDADRVYVMDNGVPAAMRNALERRGDIILVDCEGMGIHEMWNLGAGMALAEWRWTDVAFLNNDIAPSVGMVGELAGVLEDHPEVTVVCPNYDGREVDLEFRGDICAERYDGTGGIAGFAFMVRAEFLWQYQFPEQAKWWYGDNDLLLSLQVVGGAAAITGRATVEHLDGGGGPVWRTPEMKDQLEADREWFVSKWQAQEAGS